MHTVISYLLGDFWETAKQINAKFCGKVATISTKRFQRILHFFLFLFFFFFKFGFLNFSELFFIFVNIGPHGSENFKTLLILQFNQTFSTYSL